MKIFNKNMSYIYDEIGPEPELSFKENPEIFKNYISNKRRKNAREILSILISILHGRLSNVWKEAYKKDCNFLKIKANIEYIEDSIKFGVYPSQKWIAHKAGCCQRTVNYWIKWFRDKGIISTHRGYWEVSFYRITGWLYKDEIIQILGKTLPTLYEIRPRIHVKQIRKILTSN